IRFGLRIAAILLFEEGQRIREVAFVDVHDMRDANSPRGREMLVVILAAAPGRPCRMTLVVPANAQDRDVDGFVGARLRPTSLRERQGQPGGGGGSLRKEETTVHHVHPSERGVS